MKTELTAARARELIRYEPETGDFYYTARRSNVCRKDGLAGTKGPGGRIQVRLDKKVYLAHRVAFLLVTGEWPKNVVDHIDGNPSNNCWSNLRDVSQQTNSYNIRGAPRHSKHAKLLGAHWCSQRELWKSSIKVNGAVQHLGVFDSAEEASAAYFAAKRVLHPGFML
jgi:hypothetical protein